MQIEVDQPDPAIETCLETSEGTELYRAVAAEHERRALGICDASGRLEGDLAHGLDVLFERMLSVGEPAEHPTVAMVTHVEASVPEPLEQVGAAERGGCSFLSGGEGPHAARHTDHVDRSHPDRLPAGYLPHRVTGWRYLSRLDAGCDRRAARHTEDVTTEVRNPSVAPGDLELVRAFVNTLDIEAGTDDLATPSSSAAWLEASGWPTRVDRSEREELVRAREALRDLVSATRHVGRAPRHRGDRRDRPPVSDHRPNLVAVSAGAVGEGRRGRFVERILGLVAAARIDGSWERMKTCANGGCRWLFYDHSRNRSRTWCTMDLCGSQAKMRAYRRRRVAADHPAEREGTA